MADPKSVIQFNAGQHGQHSYFYIGEDGHSKRAARVSMSTMSKIRKALLHREEIGLPISNMAEFLATFLPVAFLVQLKPAGIGMIEAWEYMANFCLTISGPVAVKACRYRSPVDRQAYQLARVLSVVSGGRRTAKELALTLKELVQACLPQALVLLQQWIDEYGYTASGYPRIGNRANRSAKNRSTKGSVKAA